MSQKTLLQLTHQVLQSEKGKCKRRFMVLVLLSMAICTLQKQTSWRCFAVEEIKSVSPTWKTAKSTPMTVKIHFTHLFKNQEKWWPFFCLDFYLFWMNIYSKQSFMIQTLDWKGTGYDFLLNESRHTRIKGSTIDYVDLFLRCDHLNESY